MSIIALKSGWKKIEEIWLSVFEDPATTHVMLGGLVEERFERLRDLKTEVLRDPPWDRGCVFSESHTLKWKRRFGDWHAVFISDENPPVPEGFEVLGDVAITPQGDCHDLLLWGASEEGKNGFVFFENRVPKARAYPVGVTATGMRAFLRVRRYSVLFDPQNHALASGGISRWCGLVCVP